HVGLNTEGLEKVKQPFTSHPKIYHDINDFGCTICHMGQGLATSYKESKGLTKFWNEPMLPDKYLESSCGICHKTSVVPEAHVLTRGRQLIENYNCAGCHNLEGFKPLTTISLDGIGSKVSRKWLTHWLKNPKEFQPKTKMPNFNLSDEEINLLSDFLMTFKTYPREANLETIPSELTNKNGLDEELVANGKKIFREARCISCHLINDRGGFLAPEIGKIASKASPEWIYNFIKNPKSFQPDIKMPQFGFNKDELKAVTAYILSEFIDYDEPEKAATENTGTDPNFYAKGLKLFNQYNCSACHNLTAKGVSKNPGPDLKNIGGKKLYELDFKETGIEKSLPSYLYAKINKPRQFFENSRMPDFKFNKDDIEAITTALLSIKDESIPDKYKILPEPESTYQPQGAFGKIIKKYSCLSCHVIYKKGFLLATDLSKEGSRVNEDWLKNYFKIPYTLRPTLTERMPNLFMSEEDIELISKYFSLVLVDDEISQKSNLEEEDPALIEKGKNLFYEKYACQSCHQIGSKGGYVGPPLDKSGSRLTKGWVFQWIKNPQKYRPDVIEPNHGLNDDEANAITAYIMSLK
ncbi:MAG TPA: c-type cytochrome, partial [Draconibacterium sp.]|nr:c-type cytochrome [Draconibacterium sp.]